MGTYITPVVCLLIAYLGASGDRGLISAVIIGVLSTLNLQVTLNPSPKP